MGRAVLLLFLVGLGCVQAPVKSADPGWALLSATPGTDQLLVRGSKGVRWMAITDTSAIGPNYQLKRTPTTITGTTGGDFRPVSLQMRGDGMIGEEFDVSLRREGDTTRVTGLLGQYPSTFWLSRSTFRGNVGPCEYQLGWSASMYVGTSQCGPTSEEVSIQIPAALAQWNDGQVAALLVLLLMR